MTEPALHADDQWRELSVPRLIRGLRALAEPEERADRAALAALRRGLGKRPGEAPEMFPVLIPLLPQGRLRQWDEHCAYTVAALFAMHPASWDGAEEARRRRNLGASLRRLREATDSDGPERRMVALLNSNGDDLPEHLRAIVALLRGADVPIDWNQLAYDLLAWNFASRDVQRRWASAFWWQAERSEEASYPDNDGDA
jgi:CRISPR system Cascade subunit CasB